MKEALKAVLALILCTSFALVVYAQEQAKESAAKPSETAVPSVAGVPLAAPEAVSAASVAAPVPSAGDVQKTISEYILMQKAESGTFDVFDDQTDSLRELTLISVHDKVSKADGRMYICADFSDDNTGEKIDLDFDMEEDGGKLNVTDFKIHKVDGIERYSYDAQGNRTAVKNEHAKKAAVDNAPAAQPQAPKLQQAPELQPHEVAAPVVSQSQ